MPKTQKDVKSFFGKINFIGRFIAQLTHTCEFLFKLLKKNMSLYWSEECQQVFDKIKDYLLHPSVLVAPKPSLCSTRLWDVFWGIMMILEKGSKTFIILVRNSHLTRQNTHFLKGIAVHWPEQLRN